MSPTQLFHIPTSLKRAKSTAVTTPKRHTDRHEAKAERILGLREGEIETARNHSSSSATTTKLQGNLSDATTEFGTSLPRDERIPQLPELHLKASSVILRDEIFGEPTSAISVRSGRLKTYDSSSTLYSHYDPSRAPLSISQQTSDSSRRDFALRKGTPSVVRQPQPRDTQRPAKAKSLKLRSEEPRKLSKERPKTGTSHISVASTRPSVRRDSPPEPLPSNHVRFAHQPKSAQQHRPALPMNNTLLEPLDPQNIKINIRRPKVGARHWFDGHEGDSSDEENDEPAFEETFVSGVESAFQEGRIKPPSDTSTITNTIMSPSQSSTSTPKSHAFPLMKQEPPLPSPRIATLNAKASTSSLRPPQLQSPASKRRADPLAKLDLTKSSVLNLSSSDDEDEPLTPTRLQTPSFGPAIRDSVAMTFSESQVELGTAETVSAVPGEQSTVKTLRVLNQQDKGGRIHMSVPKRTSSRMLSFSQQHAESDLLHFFPATPLESIPSHRTSIRSSATASEAGSLESRRFMSVTKQEESLLAAMRLKKATMRYHTTRDNRMATLKNLERTQSSISSRTDSAECFVSATELIVDTRIPQKRTSTTHRHRRSLSNDDAMYPRASGTTFQTSTTRNPSRLSVLTFHTETSEDNMTRLSMSSEGSQEYSESPSHLSSSKTDRRESRDTFISSSSPGISNHVRRPTAQSHVVALDELDMIPSKREDISSQDFIDWPYNGWEARAKLGLSC